METSKDHTNPLRQPPINTLNDSGLGNTLSPCIGSLMGVPIFVHVPSRTLLWESNGEMNPLGPVDHPIIRGSKLHQAALQVLGE